MAMIVKKKFINNKRIKTKNLISYISNIDSNKENWE